jgi:hypothetical protein
MLRECEQASATVEFRPKISLNSRVLLHDN